MARPEHMTTTDLGGMREKAAQFAEGARFVSIITGLILVNAVTLGLETSPWFEEHYGVLLHRLDKAILVVFSIEMAVKLYAYRLGFFRSGWNNFDLFVTLVSWVPFSGPFSVLRTLRILRVLRLFSVVPQMRKVVTALGKSIPGMTSVMGVLMVVFYVFSVLATKLYGAYDAPHMQDWFGSIGKSAYTLFQVMTLDGWSNEIVRPVMKTHPWAWAFFVPFVVMTSFAVLNLFIGIIVDAMRLVDADKMAVERRALGRSQAEQMAVLLAKIEEMNAEIKSLRDEKKPPPKKKKK